jgi:hypothetical protein
LTVLPAGIRGFLVPRNRRLKVPAVLPLASIVIPGIVVVIIVVLLILWLVF